MRTYYIVKFVFVFLSFFLCVQCVNHSQLSTKQKLQDFEFLYQTLEENYPYFGVTKRQSNVDWLSRKSEYLERIRNTPNDSAYFMSLCSIVNELNCPHLNVVLIPETMLDVYKRATIEKPKYAKWVEVLEKSKKQSFHWQKILENISGTTKQASQIQPQITYYSDSLLAKDKIAIMRIKSFSYDNLANDSVQIISFLKKNTSVQVSYY